MNEPKRWIAQPINSENPEDAGSVFACREHAKDHADTLEMVLGECQGSEGVDALTYCPLCPQ